MDTHPASLLLLLLALIHLILHISARDSLSPGSSLSVERKSDVLLSQNGIFTCGFYNIYSNAATFSIWFSNTSDKTIVWSANLLHPVYTWGSKVKLNVDGSMVLQDYNGQIVWTNNVNSLNTEQGQAQLLNTGNLIVKGKGDFILWQSFDSPTDTLLPTQNITAATKLVSTSRLLVPSRYSFHFDDQYLLSLFYYYEKDLSLIYWPNPTKTIWAKGRKQFNSTTTGVLDSLGHFLGSDNLTFTAADWGSRIMRRLTLDYDGGLRLYSLNKEYGNWSVTWMAFPHVCREPGVAGLCGRNGICVHTPEPACVCAPGYKMIDPSDWSQGCRRKINITCDEKKVTFVKLPKTDFNGFDLSEHGHVSLDFCKNLCLHDCKCNGFAYSQGTGGCYPKSVLLNGISLQHLDLSIYLKLPKGVLVSGSSIPQSQFFGPKYSLNCTKNISIVQFLDNIKSGRSELKYFYSLYGFLSAIFLAEVTFIVFGWLILRREGLQLRGVWPAEAGYEMITNHFRRYTYRELVTATRKFQDELGRGASGIVYKGILKDSRAVAVKKLADINKGREEFQHELTVIGRIYHMNLARVWGFCSDGPHRILVLEYVENGSLDKILFGTESSQIILAWKQRFNIALGVAKGLAYLHHECSEWVIHCDMKPENILLDENLEPKIADFGLAKLLNRGGSNINVSRIQGTRGYLAPEWISSLPITAKVDVYSFGAVLLELLKGARVSELERNDEEEVEMALGRVIRMLAEKLKSYGNEQSWITNFIDTRLNGQFSNLQARMMMKLAVSCLEEDRSRRPTMESVVQMLVSVDEANSTI